MQTNALFRLLLVFTLFTLCACRSSKEASTNRKQYKEIYLSQFKLTYFKKLLSQSYNHSDNIKTLIKGDSSGFTEPILSEKEYKLIDSLVKVDNNYLVADSAASIGRVAEGGEGKHVLGFIMYKIRSKWLDSLALDSYKRSDIKSF